ncbi:MAG: hypothetical protein WCP79_07000 [Bacillota bacterium]
MGIAKDIAITIAVKDLATSALKNIEKQFKSLPDGLRNGLAGVGGVVTGLTTVIGGIATGLATATKAAVEYGVAVQTIRRSTGASAEEVSKLYAIMRYGGVETEQAENMMGKFGKSISMAKDEMIKAQSEGKQSNDIFSRLGMTLQDISGKNLTEVYELVAKKISGMTDAADKDRAAIELFGKSGMKMMETLGLSGEQIDAITKKAEAMGMVLSDKDAEAAEKLDKTMNSLSGTFKKMWIQIGNELMPQAQEYLGGIKSLAEWTLKLNHATDGLAASLVLIGITAVPAYVGISRIAVQMGLATTATMGWVGALVVLAGALTYAVYKYSEIEDARTQDAEIANEPNRARWSSGSFNARTGFSGSTAVMVNPQSPEARSDIDQLNLEQNALKAWKKKQPKDSALAASLAAQNEISGLIPKYETPKAAGGAKTDDTARQYEAAADKLAGIQDSLTAKLKETTGGFVGDMAKIEEEYSKTIDELNDLSKKGVDTTQAKTLAKGVLTQEEADVEKKRVQSLTDCWLDAKITREQTSGDMIAVATDEYNKTVELLGREKEEVLAKTNDMATAEEVYNSKLAAAVKKRDGDIKTAAQAKKDADQAEIDATLANNINLARIAGQGQEAIDALTMQGLIKRREVLKSELDDTTITDEQKARIRSEYVGTLDSIANISPKDMTLAKQWTTQMDIIKKSLPDYTNDITNAFTQMGQAGATFAGSIITDFSNIGTNFNSFAQSLGQAFVNMLSQMAADFISSKIQSLIAGLFTATGSGTSLINAVAGWFGHDYGGLAAAGEAITVGERGPEVFVPSTSGSIVPANRQSALPPNITIEITNNAAKDVEVSSTQPKVNMDDIVMGIIINSLRYNKGGSKDAMRAALA